MTKSATRVAADGELFKSTGIDDNATSTAITIDASENVGIGLTSGTGKLAVQGYVASGGQNYTLQLSDAVNSTFRIGHQSGLVNLISDQDIGLYTSSVERVRVTDNGLTFNGDTAAANALDDYEEGTWTCTIRGSSAEPATLTSTTNSYYTKIGNVVTFQVSFESVSTTGYGGAISFTTLPFVNNGFRAVTAIGVYRMGTWTDTPTGMIENGGTTIGAADHRSGNSWTDVQHNPQSAGGYLWITGTYRTNS